jgi:GNAT superfamily N-acetyltransferase
MRRIQVIIREVADQPLNHATDRATFAYLGDVFVVEEHRGKGLSKWLMKVIVEQPDLQGLRRWLLATRDAHILYEQFNFAPLRHPERWMER